MPSDNPGCSRLVAVEATQASSTAIAAATSGLRASGRDSLEPFWPIATLADDATSKAKMMNIFFMATPHLSFGQFVSQQTDHSIEQINIFSDSHNVGA